ncbi:MAG TPA: MBOAT family protein [Epsilonproteobacteria bacterium]|nr:MBOAT family protein [Campylobacterota bacterium]
MLFNSYAFIFFFLPAAFFGYFFLLRQRMVVAAKSFLVFASLFFYSWWNVAYLPLILTSMLFNYTIGSTIGATRTPIRIGRKKLLLLGIIGNVSLLGYFKYADFFIENINVMLGTTFSLLHMALPLAISFFTFQQIAYLVDSYRGETKEYDFLNYALFVTFFPQLIAGPIVHHREMMPQFASRWNLVKQYRHIAAGLFLFTIGLFKKVIIADTFGAWATNGFDYAKELNLIEAWLTSLSYTFQLYFDFSGYTDMAIGAALLFNIKLPFNFNSPYKAVSIQDFWHRWHITLSRFLRDYIYIPLGGNRHGHFFTYQNLLLTFLIGGIWHGAGWGFVLWGTLHGFAMIVHRYWQSLSFTLPKLLAWFITFNFINITWVFFRAQSINDAIKVVKGMFFGTVTLAPEWLDKLPDFGQQYGAWLQNLYATDDIFIWIFLALIFVSTAPNSNWWLQRFRPQPLLLAVSILMMLYALLNLTKVSQFLYFNF